MTTRAGKAAAHDELAAILGEARDEYVCASQAGGKWVPLDAVPANDAVGWLARESGKSAPYINIRAVDEYGLCRRGAESAHTSGQGAAECVPARPVELGKAVSVRICAEAESSCDIEIIPIHRKVQGETVKTDRQGRPIRPIPFGDAVGDRAPMPPA